MSAALLGCLPWPGKNRPPLVIRMSSCRRNLRGFHLSSAGKAKLMVKLRISYAGEAQLIVEYHHNLSFIYIYIVQYIFCGDGGGANVREH